MKPRNSTAYPIRTNPHPMRDYSPLHPMDKHDRVFWALLHSRRLAALAVGQSSPVIEAGAGTETPS